MVMYSLCADVRTQFVKTSMHFAGLNVGATRRLCDVFALGRGQNLMGQNNYEIRGLERRP